jgi:trimeric autotransporter adhesin
MTDTTFVSKQTHITAAWLNDVNITVYRALGAAGVSPTTPAKVLTNLGLADNGGNLLVPKLSDFSVVFTGGMTVTLAMVMQANASVGGNLAVTGTTGLTGALTVQSATVGLGGGALTSNAVLGANALQNNTTGYDNVAVGQAALNSSIDGFANVAVGKAALSVAQHANANIAIGYNCMASTTNGIANVAAGYNTMANNTAGSENVALGYNALPANLTGNFNTALGYNALVNGTVSNNTALGASALAALSTATNCTGVGQSTDVTGSNQVQLGNSATTTYAYGAVQNRSDIRDKADVRDTQLGLAFILKLRPVDFKWDMREDYRPAMPTPPKVDAPKVEWDAYKLAQAHWLATGKINHLAHNGSKKRNRYHHGLIAQEVQAVAKTTGVEFGGLQDHKIAGGDDVLSLGYTELVGPLIKALQELNKKFDEYVALHP